MLCQVGIFCRFFPMDGQRAAGGNYQTGGLAAELAALGLGSANDLGSELETTG